MIKQADLVVVGGGAAGCIAALIAAKEGLQVILAEKNKSIGRKLAITGGGRCNVTNDAEIPELINNTPGNGRFLYSAFQKFGPDRVKELFEEELGVRLKTERGNRVFPVSDQAQEVVSALYQGLTGNGVAILTQTKVNGLLFDQGKISGVSCENGLRIEAGSVIVATGGLSYPGTGSTGDGYGWAKRAGLTVTECYPALVPLDTKERWPEQVEGLSLININLTAWHHQKKLGAEFGEMLFTRYGVSGPVVLSLSRSIAPLVQREPGSVRLEIDLKPALSEEELDLRVQRDFAAFINKQYKNSLDELLPRSMIPVFIELSEVEPAKPVHQVSREERKRIVGLLKRLPLTISGARSFNEAIVTNGGVSVKELDPKSMESKKVPGLYFVGEVVDVDAYTGGFNLQIAFSMGYAAGQAVAKKFHELAVTGGR